MSAPAGNAESTNSVDLKGEGMCICVRKKNLNSMHYQDLKQWTEDPSHVYIGRSVRFVEGASHSKWHNPFSVKKHGRKRSLQLYEEWIISGVNPCTKKKRGQGPLMKDIGELKGKILGCWCKPLDCHGDVLLKLLSALESIKN
eukprot:jgi/Bigna1/141355/aug1.62_g16063